MKLEWRCFSCQRKIKKISQITITKIIKTIITMKDKITTITIDSYKILEEVIL